MNTKAGIVKVSRLNVRPRPSTNKPSIGQLSRGDRVEILRREGNWYRIKAGALTGYVYGKYVAVGERASATAHGNERGNMPSADREAGMSEVIDARVFLLLMAARMVGDYLYAWGGEEAGEGGFDCSGFASVALMQTARAWPVLYDGGRTTASGLYKYFDNKHCSDITRIEDLKPGCLVFYRRPGKRIHHIAIHATTVPPIRLEKGGGNRPVEVGPVAFESGGSGSAATTPRAALAASAGVRLTASDSHGRGVKWVAKDPFVLLEQ